ncbi:HlyD family efflux transporter periplasmic adaptor subunit [Lentzea tibetensis]|uniref:HlyD family efflux transporter periplasmic adaptor subunit n=1 Tax=Lentzea tibetensis TaxID=2591470 RepID=A0A563EER1_9PSEU|nr:HlyD family efflux transporter periplasmic adaptor subunit [Lentzea tibetensis]TWP43574.1 HlyD family efflux transporter periplasmic adaptor subunit [Lentzea tibetensis]
MEFRRSALDALEGPEDLDSPVRLTSTRGWLALASLGLVVVVACMWGFSGSMPRKMDASGVLAGTPEVFAVQSTADGRLDELLVKPGNTVAAGAPIATVTTNASGVQTVRAAMAGRVVAVPVSSGKVVVSGTTLASLARVDGSTGQLSAVVLLPVTQGSGARPGRDVDLTVQSVPTTAYGVLRGKVVSVEPVEHPEQGAVLKVLVALLPTGETPSGYVWSTQQGPPNQLLTGASVSAVIHLPAVSPIEMMSP